MENSEDLKNENKKNNSFIIIMELFKGNDGYILKLIKKEGSRRDFFDKYKDIAEIVQKLVK